MTLEVKQQGKDRQLLFNSQSVLALYEVNKVPYTKITMYGRECGSLQM